MIVYQVSEYPSVIFSTITKAKRWARSKFKNKMLKEATIVAKGVDGLALSYVVSTLNGTEGKFLGTPDKWWDNKSYFSKRKSAEAYILGLR